MIGIAIITHNRPDAYNECRAAIAKHWPGNIVTVHDGEPAGYNPYQITATTGETPQGVAVAKNLALHILMDQGCRDLFLVEDDVRVCDSRVWDEYRAAAAETGWHYLSWGHGPYCDRPRKTSGRVRFWANYAAGFEFMTAQAVTISGGYDTRFVNAFEHVELALRLASKRLTASYGEGMVDVNRNDLLADISCDTTRPDHTGLIGVGMETWKRVSPATFRVVYGA